MLPPSEPKLLDQGALAEISQRDKQVASVASFGFVGKAVQDRRVLLNHIAALEREMYRLLQAVPAQEQSGETIQC